MTIPQDQNIGGRLPELYKVIPQISRIIGWSGSRQEAVEATLWYHVVLSILDILGGCALKFLGWGVSTTGSVLENYSGQASVVPGTPSCKMCITY